MSRPSVYIYGTDLQYATFAANQFEFEFEEGHARGDIYAGVLSALGFWTRPVQWPHPVLLPPYRDFHALKSKHSPQCKVFKDSHLTFNTIYILSGRPPAL